MALDAAGNLFIVTVDNRVRKVAAGTGTITTVAGNGGFGYNGDNGPAINATLFDSQGIALDGAGNLYIADTNNNIIREVNAKSGIITTVAGTPPTTQFGGSSSGGYSGDGGPATSAKLNIPVGIAIDGAGNLYIADDQNDVIRKVTASIGIITTVAGKYPPYSYSWGGDGDSATEAHFYNPSSVSVDSTGNLYITEEWSKIREVTVSGVTPTTVTAAPLFSVSAGSYASPQTVTLTDPTPGAAIYVTLNGAAPTTLAAGYHGPINVTGAVTIQAIAVAPGDLPSEPVSAAYTITAPPTAVISTVAGNGTQGLPDTGAGGPATSAEIGAPQAVALDASGNLYFSDNDNNVVWMVSASTGIISIVAGNGTRGYYGDNGPATSAQLESIGGLAVDSAGNLFISDTNDDVVREVAATTGVINTIAGTWGRNICIGNTFFPTCQFGDGGPAASAILAYPEGLAVDSAGNLYIADTSHYVVRKITASTGIITTVAGNQTEEYSGDGGPATSAGLLDVETLAVDSADNLYISSINTGRIRKVTASTGMITTVAGIGNINGNSGDGGLAIKAEIYPEGIAVDAAGNLYLSSGDDAVREVSASTGIITTVAGNGYYGTGGDGGSATAAGLEAPQGIAVDVLGNLYIADEGSYRIREVTYPGKTTSAPTFSPAAGSFTAVQTVYLTDATAGASIYYTTDGTTPTTSSTLYTSAGITVSASETINAIATASGYAPSAVASAAYVITLPQNPAPIIDSLAPAYASAGGAAFTLTVTGSNFINGSTVYWGTTALATTFGSASQLTAAVTAAEIAGAGQAAITVKTPAPGGGASNGLEFEIDSAGSTSTAPTITVVVSAVSAGSPASYTVSLPSTVESATVSCLNLPAGAACSYAAGTLTITTGSSTPKGTYKVTVIFTETVSGAAAGWILLPFLLLPLVLMRRRLMGRGAWMRACLGLILLAGAACCATGCGGGGGSTSGGGGGGSQTHQVVSSSTVTLTVQ